MSMYRAPMSRLDRLRPVWVGLTIVFVALTMVEVVALYRIIDDQNAVAVDLKYYRFVADRWLDSGVFYTDRQLLGSYGVRTLNDNLYPPHALYLFIPFLTLPGELWWGIPLGIYAYVVLWCRPAIWAWPIIAACILYPKTANQIIYGNTDMWLAAFIAGGVRWGWPAVLISLKPSLAIFGFLGILSRGWWIGAAVIAVASLPFLTTLLDYPTVMMNSDAKFYYSFGNLPFFVLPVIAWLASTRRRDTPARDWALGLLRGGSATLARLRR